MKTILLLFVLICIGRARTQSINCGEEGMQQLWIGHCPDYEVNRIQNNELLYSILTTQQQLNSEKTIYTIPVVFHIMHQGGPENITDASVIQAVAELNQRFQNSGQYFDATGHPADIQFCLASVDPWGNPTTGITHDYSSLLSINYPNYLQDWTLKTQNRWNPMLYLNIWSVGNIADMNGNPGGVGGYSTYPGAPAEMDGIVARYTYVTSGALLAHEVGHYLNLYHTFNGCTNFNCLLDGDFVCDTPPDQSNDNNFCQVNSCATEMNDTSGFNPFSGDVNELPNYMDYTSCPLSFTAGQVNRMQLALTQLRPSLLESNACGSNPGGPVPVAAFTIDSSFCKGTGKYGFHSTGTHALYCAWDFDNNGSIDTVGADVTHRFATSGSYAVKLYVSGYGGADTLSQTINVFVAPTPYYPISASSGTMIDPIMQSPYACINSEVTLYGTPGMTGYSWSNGESTPNITVNMDTTTEFSLTVITPAGDILTSCQTYRIGVNPNPHLQMDIGADTVDCGDQVVLRCYPIPYWFPATNTWYRNGGWFSENQTVVGSYGIPQGDQYVWVENNIDPNGCVTDSDTIHFFVRDPLPVSLNFDGTTLRTSYDCIANFWYRDGVQVPGSDSALVVTQNGCYWSVCLSCAMLTTDTICITDLSSGPVLENLKVEVFPNPFSDALTIRFAEVQQGTYIVLTDLTGKSVKQVLINGTEVSVEREKLAAGIYLLNIWNEQGQINYVRKITIE